MARKPNTPKTIYRLDPECTISLRVGQINLLNELIERDKAMDFKPVEDVTDRSHEYAQCPVCGTWYNRGGLDRFKFCETCGQRFSGKVKDYVPFEEMED